MVRPLDKIDPFIVVVGPTASGKSALAMRICHELSGEIVSCDSVQIYRRLDIGSAKPSAADRKRVRHHLIDIADVGEDYDAGRYAKDARRVIAEIQSRNRTAVVVGGTGLYLRALLGDQFHQNLPRDNNLRAKLSERDLGHLYKLLHRLDPERAAQLHPNDRIRIERAVELRLLLGHPIQELPPPDGGLRDRARIIYLNPDSDELRLKIKQRTEQMLAAGLVDEVKALLRSGVSSEEKPMRSIGYAQVCAMLRGELREDELITAIATATAQYAKRQRTWFKKLEAPESSKPEIDQMLKTLVQKIGRSAHE